MRVLACIGLVTAVLAGPLLAADSRKTVAVGDLTVSYGEFGPVDGVPMVLVHGGGITSRMWGGFAPEAAAAGYHVFAPDTRNHGGTDNPSGTFSYDLAAGDLAGFITALKLDQPVVMGYSDGGMIVATFLLADPAMALAQALPNGEIAIIPGAHHTVFRDNPVIFNALVLDFLTRHKAH